MEVEKGRSTNSKVDAMTLIDEIRVVSTMLEEVVATREGTARVELLASKLQETPVSFTRAINNVPKVVTSIA